MVGEIGSIRLKKLLEYFGSPGNILKASAEKLSAVSGIGEKTAQEIASFKKEDLDKELASVKKLGLKIITQGDIDYPENLKSIYDPPIVLYVKGELKREDKFSLGIVGSRRASYYGLNSAEKFAYGLCENSFTIVSGMARGIDTSSHRGALKAGGRTIAVMGSGFQHIYPPENKKLAEEIAAKGAVLSEFPCDMKPLPQNFPRRNRVISGLSLGVLVVEAAKNSGALITADFALEQGRDVFALPGKVDANTSFGTNELIKQGAKLVSCVEDIAEEFNFSIKKEGIKIEMANKSITSKDLAGEESLLYNLIHNQPLHLDAILEKAALNISQVSQILLNLEIRKLIRQLPGKQFIRSS
ncbi:MAG: DNA-processing protein DprA [Candidatus Omnitrophota bacterium]